MNASYRMLLILILVAATTLAVVGATPTVEWTRTFGSSQLESVRDVIQTSEGGYLVYGTTAASGVRQLWLIKLSAQGDIEWEDTYGGNGSETAWSMMSTEDGGYLLAGSYAETEESPRGFGIYKVSAQGDREWDYISNVSNNANRPLITSSGEGGYAVFCVATMNQVQGILHTLLNAEGELSKTEFIITDPGFSIPNDIVRLDDGHVLLFGEGGAADYNVWDGLLMSISPNGAHEWTARVGGSGSEEGYGITQTSDNAVIVIGVTMSPGTRGGPDVYLSKLSLAAISFGTAPTAVAQVISDSLSLQQMTAEPLRLERRSESQDDLASIYFESMEMVQECGPQFLGHAAISAIPYGLRRMAELSSEQSKIWMVRDEEISSSSRCLLTNSQQLG